jgi:hypothetical protein
MGLIGFLPQHVVEKMTEDGRRAYGKAVGHRNAGKTQAEIEEEIAVKEERKLQEDLRQYLNGKIGDDQYINPSMNKRSPLPPGWPDFTFCYRGFPVLWECKKYKKKLRDNQEEIVQKQIQNGWRFALIRSLTQARDFLRDLDQELVKESRGR